MRFLVLFKTNFHLSIIINIHTIKQAEVGRTQNVGSYHVAILSKPEMEDVPRMTGPGGDFLRQFESSVGANFHTSVFS